MYNVLNLTLLFCAGTMCTVTGWGHLQFGSGWSPDVLHKGTVPTVSYKYECIGFPMSEVPIPLDIGLYITFSYIIGLFPYLQCTRM